MNVINSPQALEADGPKPEPTSLGVSPSGVRVGDAAYPGIGEIFDRATLAELETVTLKLASYCKARNWSGYDPYDALNSRIIKYVPFLDNRVSRIAATQLLRRSPWNLRPLLLIPPTQNAKAIALFLSAFLKLEAIGLSGEGDVPSMMIDRLIALRSTDPRYWSWGYSFPWQGRTVLVPAGAPNLVCTLFVANSLLDAYEQRHDDRCLDMASGAADYMLRELYWTDGETAAGFSYPLPGLKGETHNANLLAAAFLCRLYECTDDPKVLGPSLRVVRHSVSKQQRDGSWYYGEAPSQRWIDNFHTGYNLCALQSVSRSLGTTEFDSSIQRGLDFYLSHFFREDGAPRYFYNRTYPIDIHSVAQSLITLVALRNLNSATLPLASSVFRWVMGKMWDERGFFYYRVLRSCRVRTPYMRWAQAWMFLALSTLLSESGARLTRVKVHV